MAPPEAQFRREAVTICAMSRQEEVPGCRHHIHLSEPRQPPTPTQLCSCPGGLIHMHDCPVLLGRGCAHFAPVEGAPAGLSEREHEALRQRLMEDFLDQTYRHRVQALAPEGSAWQRRRAELHERYRDLLEGELSQETDPTPEEQEAYERERETLIAARRVRDEERRAREEKTKEERAQERARMGIRTVVEKARDTVEAQGNVAASLLDPVAPPPEAPQESPPAGGRGRSRRRRRGPPSGESPASGGEPRRRRRRRRRGGGGGAGGGATSGGGGAPPA